jgi:N-acetylglucosamine kinase-like BadF-type ATPase
VKVRAQSASDEVFPRLFSVVASLAETGDAAAQGILRAAAMDLAMQVDNLAARLRLYGTKFLLAKTGGMMGRSKYLEAQLDERLCNSFPEAELGQLRMTPAEAAGRVALLAIASV